MFRKQILFSLLLLSVAFFAVVGLLFTLDKQLVLAATNENLTVNTLVDENDNCNVGNCSLREAINDVNVGGTIDFGISGTIDLSGNGELTIDKSLTISSGVPITISGDNATRIFNILSGNIYLNNLNIVDGNVQTDDCEDWSDHCGGGIMIHNNTVIISVTNSVFFGNNADFFGGSIFNHEGMLFIDNNIFSNNTAQSGGSIYNKHGQITIEKSSLISNSANYVGGGIYNDGIIAINDSIIRDNSAVIGNGGGVWNQNIMTITHSNLSYNIVGSSRDGGAIINREGQLSIFDTTITNNSAGGSGGGIFNGDYSTGTAIANVENSLIINNSAFQGGGITNYASLNVYNSTLSNNSAYNSGGIYNTSNLFIENSTLATNSSTDMGGGISNSSVLEINNSTFFSNTTDTDGGGIANFYMLTINNSTFSENLAGGNGGAVYSNGTFHLSNSILANAPSGNDCYGSLITDDHNLIEMNEGCGTLAINADPQLQPLNDNGGVTWTHALSSISPALDAGNPTTCLKTDQRGIQRPQGDGCDIGAFELGGKQVFLPVILQP